MQDTHWQETYLRTIQEVNAQKVQHGIAATRQAITGRLRDIDRDSDHHAERQQMEKVLKALGTLEAEVQDW